MDHITEALCRAAVVKTLVQVPEVETVDFTVTGQELADLEGNPIGIMSDETFIDTKGEGINSYQYAVLSLYFADESGAGLTKEMRNVHFSSNSSIERVVVEQLLKGPANSKLQAVIPENIKILEASVEGTVCTINLDSAFNQKIPGAATSAQASIYAIVNAICDNCEVTKVQIEIEGDATVKYLDEVDISKPLGRKDDIINQIEETEETEEIQETEETEETESKQTEAQPPQIGVDPSLQ